ncbi:MAG: MFS transporter [Legionellales bacterium]|nr:MFS transporter [Legionellales bacterium]
MKKISIISAFLGTLIEVYDFSVFAFLIPILSEVFFSSHTTKVAINFTVLAYVISYGVKPVGALTFGYLIDAYGRKKVLLLTTFLMTVVTATIGLLPLDMPRVYQWWALIGCRIIQGLSISGEFSSAIIMAVEQGRKRPAFFGSMAFIGGSLGLLLANISVYILLNFMPHDQMIRYGWRIPFLISTFFWLILFMIRSNIDDVTSVKGLMRHGIRDLMTTHKRALVTVFIISSLSASAFYMTFVFMPTFLSTSLNLHSHQTAVLITLICLLIYVLALPLGGLLADKIGVRKQIKVSSLLYLLFACACFAMLPGLNSIGCLTVLAFFAMIQALLNSALPAFMVTQFDQMQRGKALAISYNISLTIFGGLMPYLILTNEIHLNPGVPISMCAVLTLIVMHWGR